MSRKKGKKDKPAPQPIPQEADMGEFVDLKEAERLSKKDERTLRRYIKRGLLTKYRSGLRGVMLRKAEVLALIQLDPRPQTSPPPQTAA